MCGTRFSKVPQIERFRNWSAHFAIAFPENRKRATRLPSSIRPAAIHIETRRVIGARGDGMVASHHDFSVERRYLGLAGCAHLAANTTGPCPACSCTVGSNSTWLGSCHDQIGASPLRNSRAPSPRVGARRVPVLARPLREVERGRSRIFLPIRVVLLDRTAQCTQTRAPLCERATHAKVAESETNMFNLPIKGKRSFGLLGKVADMSIAARNFDPHTPLLLALVPVHA